MCGGDLKHAVSHRTEVEGNDKLYDDKQEELSLSLHGSYLEFMVEEKEEEGNLNKQVPAE